MRSAHVLVVHQAGDHMGRPPIGIADLAGERPMRRVNSISDINVSKLLLRRRGESRQAKPRFENTVLQLFDQRAIDQFAVDVPGHTTP